jgi:quinol-cytochrome oxidoreductase complex cytochrome b subunit
MFMFETLKLVPGGEILGIEYEAIPILGFGFAGLVLVLVPFLDRGLARNGKSPLFTVAGVIGVVYIVGMTAWGYRSTIPILIVGGTILLTVVFGWITRPPAQGGGDAS